MAATATVGFRKWLLKIQTNWSSTTTSIYFIIPVSERERDRAVEELFLSPPELYIKSGCYVLSQNLTKHNTHFVGLAYHGKDIVFRFIIEYSSLRDFYRPLCNNNRSVFLI
jgi:hypothetical protein